jgi:hypothetical protein
MVAKKHLAIAISEKKPESKIWLIVAVSQICFEPGNRGLYASESIPATAWKRIEPREKQESLARPRPSNTQSKIERAERKSAPPEVWARARSGGSRGANKKPWRATPGQCVHGHLNLWGGRAGKSRKEALRSCGSVAN